MNDNKQIGLVAIICGIVITCTGFYFSVFSPMSLFLFGYGIWSYKFRDNDAVVLEDER